MNQTEKFHKIGTKYVDNHFGICYNKLPIFLRRIFQMKKILAAFLATLMLVSVCMIGVSATGSGYCWFWDSDEAYGYLTHGQTTSASDLVVEFDAALFTGNDGNTPMFELWLADGLGPMSVASTYVSINGNTINYNWGTLGWSTWHHIKFVINGGAGSIYIDDQLIHMVNGGISARQGNQLLFSDFGKLALDNLIIANNAGSVYASCDVEDSSAATALFGSGLGTRTAVEAGGDDPDDPTPPIETSYVFWMDDFYEYINFGQDVYSTYGSAMAVSYEFDLALIPGDTGECVFQLWGNSGHSGNVRFSLGTSLAGVYCTGYYDIDEYDYTSFSWGATGLGYFRHVKVMANCFDNGNTSKIFVDGTCVYTWTRGPLPMFDQKAVFGSDNTYNGECVMDNLVMKSYDGATTFYSNDFETGLFPGGEYEGRRVQIGNCADLGTHFPMRKQSPGIAAKCTETGTTIQFCALCGAVAKINETPALGHAWNNPASYTTLVAPTATTKGTGRWTCARSGCSAYVDAVLPATGDYTGTLISYSDMASQEFSQDVLGFTQYADETYVTTEGGGQVEILNDITLTGNYHQVKTWVDTSGFSMSFDFRYDGNYYDSDNSGKSEIYFWFGGGNTIYNMAGYNFTEQYAFIRPTDGSSYPEVKANYTWNVGEWHNIQLRFFADPITFEAWCAIYIDGTQIVIRDDENAAFDLPYDNTASTCPIWRKFGVYGRLDNYVVGDENFAWVNSQVEEPVVVVVKGDLNSDGKINSLDALKFKLYLNGKIGDDAINKANADVTGDGKINSLDALRLKLFLNGKISQF